MPDDELDPDDRPRRRRRDDDDEDDRPRRRRRPPPDEFEAKSLILPGGSPWAIFSLYAGFVGFCLPFVGLVFAIPAFVCGIVAIRQWKKSDSYGGATSNIRAILGLVLSGLAILIWGGIGVIILLKEM